MLYLDINAQKKLKKKIHDLVSEFLKYQRFKDADKNARIMTAYNHLISADLALSRLIEMSEREDQENDFC